MTVKEITDIIQKIYDLQYRLQQEKCDKQFVTDTISISVGTANEIQDVLEKYKASLYGLQVKEGE